MSITITPQTTLQEIKTAFHQKFDSLKIDFFIDLNKDENYTSNERVSDYESTLSDLGGKGIDGVISINDSSTVSEVEMSFRELFGVIVQIFRKRGNSWLMTSATDNFTLAYLNQMGHDSMREDSDNPIDASDRRELE
ncbi:MAG: hypothetical protein LC109_14315 [Bacteroidia bacterium]|nr:hypothetical protein [Bacteroidia bacterium]MCO5252807.1 hypothetical protein [Bacteroidota bacterium]MCZ2131424.1 hypothetical protein [Bacteroidia bacterium]